MVRVAAWLIGALTAVLACGCSKKPQCFECGLTDEWARAERERQQATAEDLPPPIPLPSPTDSDCVLPADFQAYAKALEEHAASALVAALAAANTRRVERDGFFVRGEREAVYDQPYEAGDKRFVVVAHIDSVESPRVVLAQADDGSLHRIEPRARAHRIQLSVCGPNPCVYGRGAAVHSLPVAVELQPGESMQAPLQPQYDTWWVFPAYTQYRDCGPPPP